MIERKVNPKSVLAGIRNEVNGIIAELNKTTDRNITIIEEKVKQLETVLDKADKRLGLLKRENEKLGMGKTYNDILSTVRVSNKTVREAEPEENTREKIIRFYKEGISPQVIASHINVPVGEIELIISLERESNSGEPDNE
jgi:hypothetical protein